MSTPKSHPELAESAARIRDAMQAQGLTPALVAARMSMPDKYGGAVHNWMNGRNAPTPRFRGPLAEILGLDPSELVPAAWDAKPGMKAASAMSANIPTNREHKRAYNRRYKQAKKLNGDKGPAETALETYQSVAPTKGHTPVVTEVLSTSLRADGTMRIKLDVVLPSMRGITLVQLLHEEISAGERE